MPAKIVSARSVLLLLDLRIHRRRRYAEEEHMASVPERVASLEGIVSGQSNTIAGLRDDMSRLEHRMDARFAALDDRMSRQFHWIVGIQITSLIATIAAVLGALLAQS
jgi:hypothetical protein